MSTITFLGPPDLQHDPSTLPQVPQHIYLMVERVVRGQDLGLGLEHDRLIGFGDPSQKRQLLVGEAHPRRVVPELEPVTSDWADAIGKLEPAIAGERVGAELGRVHIENRAPLPREARFQQPAAGCRRSRGCVGQACLSARDSLEEVGSRACRQHNPGELSAVKARVAPGRLTQGIPYGVIVISTLFDRTEVSRVSFELLTSGTPTMVYLPGVRRS